MTTKYEFTEYTENLILDKVKQYLPLIHSVKFEILSITSTVKIRIHYLDKYEHSLFTVDFPEVMKGTSVTFADFVNVGVSVFK